MVEVLESSGGLPWKVKTFLARQASYFDWVGMWWKMNSEMWKNVEEKGGLWKILARERKVPLLSCSGLGLTSWRTSPSSSSVDWSKCLPFKGKFHEKLKKFLGKWGEVGL